jgi:hypothetical protein
LISNLVKNTQIIQVQAMSPTYTHTSSNFMNIFKKGKFIKFQFLIYAKHVESKVASRHSLKPNDFIPIHSCRGHMDDEHMKFLYIFFFVRRYRSGNQKA